MPNRKFFSTTMTHLRVSNPHIHQPSRSMPLSSPCMEVHASKMSRRWQNILQMQQWKQFALGAFFFLAFSISSHALPVIVLDPGHGGHDNGATARGVKEKYLALYTAALIGRELRSDGFHVVLTRYRDVFIPLEKRPEYANRYRSAVFVSIHYNDARRAGASGLETWWYGNHRLSKLLAVAIQANLVHFNRRMDDRGVKNNKWRVLRTCKHPAVLVECGFISNYQDRKYVTGSGLTRLTKSIARGIKRFVHDYY